MPMKTLQDAMVEELQDMLHAERQIASALPKMAAKTSNTKLREAFESHARQTEGQIERLERAFQAVGAEAKARRCEGIEGILEEGEQFMRDELDQDVLDAMLIAAAQKVEHYEIASYGTLRTWAQMLKNDDAVKLMEESLAEEKDTDQKLTEIAETVVNKQAT